MSKRDYYEVLGVDKSSTAAEIKSAFRKLAKKYHPDVSKEKDAEAKFKEAQEAYAVLSDDAKRKQYDQFGHNAFNDNGQGGYDFSGFDFSDIFGDMFGGGGFGDFFGGRSNSKRATKGRDSIMHMNITFEEAFFGTTKTISLEVAEDCSSCHGKGGHGETTCPTCAGHGEVTQQQRTMFGTFATRTTCPTCSGKGKTYKETCKVCRGTGKTTKKKDIEVKIPAGVDSGNRLRIASVGEPGYNGGPNGDVYLEFYIKPHELYHRDEEDIFLEMPITLVEATLGAKIDVPTLTGVITLTIPAGSTTGDKHRIKGKGTDNLHTHRKGDLYVVLKVIVPKKLSKEQKKLFDALKKTDLKDESFKKVEKYLKK